MKSTSFFMIALLCAFACCNTNLKKENKYDQMQAIRLSSKIPTRYLDGKIIYAIDSMDLFYYKDVIIYKVYFTNDLSYLSLNKTGDTLIPKASKRLIQNYYCGARPDSTYGYYYNG